MCCHLFKVLKKGSTLFDYRGSHHYYFPCIIPWWLTDDEVDAVYQLVLKDLRTVLGELIPESAPQGQRRGSASSVATVVGGSMNRVSGLFPKLLRYATDEDYAEGL